MGLLLCFDTYLRHGELRSLRVADVAFPGDPRLLVSEGAAAVFLRQTKAGRQQWVKVRDPLVVSLLRAMTLGVPGSAFLLGNERLELLSRFAESQLSLGLSAAVFVIHSVRHGGAAHDFLSGRSPFAEIKVRGRWSSHGITTTYLQESQARVLAVNMPKLVLDRVREYTSSNAYLWSVFGLVS